MINDNLNELNALGSKLPDDFAKMRDDLSATEGDLASGLMDAEAELTAAKRRLEKAENTILENFVSTQPEFRDMPVGNAQEAVVMLMTDGVDGANKIRALMQRTDELPEAQRGSCA